MSIKIITKKAAGLYMLALLHASWLQISQAVAPTLLHMRLAVSSFRHCLRTELSNKKQKM